MKVIGKPILDINESDRTVLDINESDWTVLGINEPLIAQSAVHEYK